MARHSRSWSSGDSLGILSLRNGPYGRSRESRKDAAKELALAYEKLNSAELELAIKSGAFEEICDDKLKSAKP